MPRPTEFAQFLKETSPYTISVNHGFITTEMDGRMFLIDLYNGDLHGQPVVPNKNVLDRIRASQCPHCFNYATPEASFHCMHYIIEGYLHPERICVVTDFPDKLQMMVKANQRLANMDLSPVQLKILSILFALHEHRMPSDIQERIERIPNVSALLKGSCPFFTSIREMKIHLLSKNINRQQRKRHFLDVLKNLQYLSSGHHSIGASYFDRKIGELQNQLATIRASTT